MLKRFGYVITLIGGSLLSFLVGESIYKFVGDFQKKPFHILRSTPWYTSVLVYGAFAFAVFGICVLLKVLFRKVKKDVWMIRF